MDKLLAGQILHPSGHLQPEAHQILHCRVLEETEPLFYLMQNVVHISAAIMKRMHVFFVCPYMSLIADEVAQVAMLHVGQNHQW